MARSETIDEETLLTYVARRTCKGATLEWLAAKTGADEDAVAAACANAANSGRVEIDEDATPVVVRLSLAERGARAVEGRFRGHTTETDLRARESFLATIADGEDRPAPERTVAEVAALGRVDHGGLPRPSVLVGLRAAWPLGWDAGEAPGCPACHGDTGSVTYACVWCDGKKWGDPRARELRKRLGSGARRADPAGRGLTRRERRRAERERKAG
jgi:hypothetical protein